MTAAERAGRKVGRYLNNIPGLTPQRLGELWRSVLHVTQDEAAICNITYFARGGMRLEIHWNQNGMKHTYPALLTAEQVAAEMQLDEDAVFTAFATRTLEAVRELGNRLAEATPEPGADVPTPFVDDMAQDRMAITLGAIRARLHSKTEDNPPAEPGTTEGEAP